MKMKKKWMIGALALLSAVILLISCGNNSGTDTENSTAAIQTAAPTQEATENSTEADPTQKDDSVFALYYGGVYAAPGRPYDRVKDALGSYYDSQKSLGCMFTDEEWEYYYSHFLLMTYRDGGVDYIGSIQFTDDVITTSEGVKIGMAEAEATAIYGTDFEDRAGTHIYTRGKTELWLQIKNGAVSNISYMVIYD